MMVYMYFGQKYMYTINQSWVFPLFALLFHVTP
jgi:hypothetical protein